MGMLKTHGMTGATASWPNLGASPSGRLRPVADPLTDPDPCALTADGCTVFFTRSSYGRRRRAGRATARAGARGPGRRGPARAGPQCAETRQVTPDSCQGISLRQSGRNEINRPGPAPPPPPYSKASHMRHISESTRASATSSSSSCPPARTRRCKAAAVWRPIESRTPRSS